MARYVKIAYNACFGGFSLSKEAVARYAELSGKAVDTSGGRNCDRADPLLVQVIEELGERANGACAKLALATVRKGTRYFIEEYDGSEWVYTARTVTWKVA